MFNDFFGIGLVAKYLQSQSNETTLIVGYVICVLVSAIASYLLGSLNFAIIISGKQYRQDIRQFGSKNAGMTNMMRTYGKKAAGLTLLGDALKAVVSCLIGTRFSDSSALILQVCSASSVICSPSITDLRVERVSSPPPSPF